MQRFFDGTRWLAQVARPMRRARRHGLHDRQNRPFHSRLQRIEQLEERTLLSIGAATIEDLWLPSDLAMTTEVAVQRFEPRQSQLASRSLLNVESPKATPESSGISMLASVVYSNMDPGPNGYVAYPPDSYLGSDDYDTTETTANVILKNSFRFVGGVTSAGQSIDFDFYDFATSTWQAGFSVTFTGGGNYIYDITLGSNITVPDHGILELTSPDTGQWFLGDAGPTLGTEDPFWGGTGDGEFSHNFELTADPDQPSDPDFGDAPESGTTYPTTLARNGARHTATGPFLGSSRDTEADGQPTQGADGDDINGTPDDEDGVVFTSALVAGHNATVDVTASAAGGYLNAWIDFNADGDWLDSGEQIFTDQSLVAGLNQLSFPVPVTSPGVTYARFRLSSQQGLSFEGPAPDGEVEDYAFSAISGSKWNDEDSEADWDGTEVGLQGWTIYVDWNNNGQYDTGEPYDITDAEGNYTITGLPAGTYTVAEVQQTGWQQTYPNVAAATLLPQDPAADSSREFAWSGWTPARIGDPGNYVADFQFTFAGAPTLVSPTDETSVIWQGLDLWQAAGEPIVPVYFSTILLPQDADVANLDIDLGDGILLASGVDLATTGLPTPLGAAGERPFPESNRFDKSFAIDMPVEWSSHRVSGYSLAALSIYPVQYDARTRTLTYHPNISVTLTASSSDRQGSLRIRETGGDLQRIAGLVDNLSAATAYADAGSGVSTMSGNLPSGGPYEYVIITSSTLDSSFQPLIDHKNARGLTAGIVTTDYIYSNFTGTEGGDSADKIRDFIATAYSTWGTEWVLLGGDTDHVPHRGAYGYVNTSPATVDENIPTDLYFACLDGPWNSDGDGIWGESNDGSSGDVDLAPDVALGRAPASTTTEAANFVNKTILYETASHSNPKQAVFLGEQLDSDTWGGNHKEIVSGYFPGDWSITEHYEKDGAWTASDLIADLNASPHIVNHDGHANTTSNAKLYPSNVDALTNASPYFMYSTGCYSGSFDSNDAIAEHHLKAEHGAFGVVMNSRYGWYWVGNNSDGPGFRYDCEFFDAVFNEDLRHLGDAHDDSKLDNLGSVQADGPFRWMHFCATLFGDPETEFFFENRIPGTHTIDLAAGLVESGWNFGNHQETSLLDFGDAPEAMTNYPTTVAREGAQHTATGLFLGSYRDTEADGQPSTAADGDDTAGTADDEDGVVFTSALVSGQTATVDVTASAAGGFLNAWIDFNSDGDWADAGEKIFNDVSLAAGVNHLSFPIPATPPDVSYARFRLSTATGLSYMGAAPDGEVEDYAFGTISGSKWNDLDGEGDWDGTEPGLQGWTIYVDWDGDGYDAGDPQAVTASDGSYSITGLPPGIYTVAEVPQTGWEQTYPGTGGAAASAAPAGQGIDIAIIQDSQPIPQINPASHREPFAAPAVQSGVENAPLQKELLAYPAAYDLRSLGRVTSVKDQGDCGSCWTFSTYGSLESSILTEGGPVRDLSENHLKNDHGFDWGPCDGGNDWISQAYLSRWSGPVDEADDPYHDYDDRPSPGGPPQYYVRESLFFDTDDEIKNALMTYGALSTSMYYDGAYYRSSDDTYYYSGTAGGNHGVTIVGWDDAKVTAAPSPGAWLIKNSWSTSWGDGGYFWLSYQDTRGGNTGTSFQAAVAPDTFGNVYYHDEYGDVSELSTPYAMNAFTAAGEEILTAVQFWTQADGAAYEVRIYDSFTGGTLSGLLAEATGTAAYAGYHTIDLPNSISLQSSDDFYVYLGVTNGGEYPQAFDYAYAGYSSASVAQPGESYYSFDGSTWTDLTSYNATANFAIKALTVAAATPGTHSVELGPGETEPGVDFGNHQLAADLDFGDAPTPYATLLADDGARHVVVPGGPYFDDLFGIPDLPVDAEADGQQVAKTASGDDVDGNDDESGVALTALVAGGTSQAFVSSSVAGALLDAWIDFNGNGVWEPSEKIFHNEPLPNAAPLYNQLPFTVPTIGAGSVAGVTYARFRISTAGVADPTGLAADGEVEDYRCLVRDPAVPATFYVHPAFATAAAGEDPDGAGPAVAYGFDSFDDIQWAISSAVGGIGDTILVAPGSYGEYGVTVDKSNLTITGSSGIASDVVIDTSVGQQGLAISASGVTIENVRVRDTYSGVYPGIGATSVSNLTLTNVEAVNNGHAGISLSNVNGATLTGVIASSNGSDGLSAQEITGTLTITGGEFSNNGSRGLSISNAETVVLNDVTARFSGTYAGASITSVASISINGGTFSDNAAEGIATLFTGSVTIDGATLSDNDVDGVDIYAASTTAVTLIDVVAENNGVHGADIRMGSPVVSVSGGSFSGNLNSGLALGESIANATIENGSYRDNVARGIYVGPYSTALIRYNNITGNTTGITQAVGAGGLSTANDNWWGSYAGPGAADGGGRVGDTTSGNVVFTPFSYGEFRVDFDGDGLEDGHSSNPDPDDDNDGRSDIDEVVIGTDPLLDDSADYGDAPNDPYGTLAASNGPAHLVGSLYLGATIDGEPDGQPDVGAAGDGTDEDGIAFPEDFIPGTTVQVEVTASAAGVLDFFFDFDRVAGFGNQPNEVFTATITGGPQLVPVTVPIDAVLGATFARFRLSSAGVLSATGPAPDGEVEDYQIMIHDGTPPTVVETAPSLTGTPLMAGTRSLQIHFSEPVLGGDTAANYQLQSLGPDALLGTADDAIIPLTVSYTGTTATLIFSPLTESIYRFGVSDALTDARGNALDGDDDGTAGGDWQTDFAVAPPDNGVFTSPSTYLNGPYSSPQAIAHADFDGDGHLDLVTANAVSGDVTLSLGDGAGAFVMAGTFAAGGLYPQALAVADFNGDGKPDLAIANSGGVGILLGTGAGGFTDAMTYASGGSSPKSVAVGDFNGDGMADLALANGSSHDVAVLLGNGTGGFAEPMTFAAGGSYPHPYGVAVGDFNGDGNDDLVLANSGSASLNVAVLIGAGTGMFAAPVLYASGGSSPYSVTVGDFNADGKHDVAVANYSSANVAVLLGDGAGALGTATTFSAGGTSPHSLMLGDFNADSKHDLAVANYSSDKVAVLLGTGTGTFSPVVSYASGGTDPKSVTAGDFNGDGKADLAVANYGSSNVGVLLNSGSGAFVAAATYDAGASSARSVTRGDFNGDEIADLAVANEGSNNVAVLLGTPTGGFATAATFASGGSAPYSVAAGDFNSDGKPDLVVANRGSNTIGVLLGTGTGDFSTVVTYASGGTSPRSVSVGDFNADGKTDLAVVNTSANDVGVLLGNGMGGFASPVLYATGGSTPLSVTVGDFDADGNADLAVANRNSNNIGVLLGEGTGVFEAAKTFDSGGAAPCSLVTGDFDADGNLDFAVANLGSDSIGVLSGNGAGGFATAVTYDSGGIYPAALTTGDFNADGKSDLAIANESGYNTGSVGLLYGDGLGGFAAAVMYGSRGAAPQGLTAGDFNADGRADLAIANGSSNNIGLLLGASTGGFSGPATYAAGSQHARSAMVADFNGDGNADVAVVNNASDVAVLLGTGTGGFAAAATYASGADYARGLTVADFNGDGNADVAVSNNINTSIGNIGVLLGTGSGALAPVVRYSSGGNNPHFLTAGDFNGDGKADLAVTNTTGHTVGVVLNTGTGEFAAAVTYPAGGEYPVSLAVGDFNGDGSLDLAVANSGSHNVGVFLGDGAGGLAAVVTYLSGGAGPKGLTVGDFDADGHLDLAVTHTGSHNVGILLGDGAGGFNPAVTYAAGGLSPASLAVSDFNADGNVDLAVANESSSNLGILWGIGGGLFAGPATYASGGSAPVSVAAGDFDADGKTDLAVGVSIGVAVLLNSSAHRPGIETLFSPQGFTFGVQTRGFGAGQLVGGTGEVFDGAGRLEVAGQTYAPVSAADFLDDSGQTVVTPTVSIAGLYVSREITVPGAGSEDFARTIDVFTNPASQPITTTVRIVGNLGTDVATTVFNTSDGDTEVEVADEWIGTDDGDPDGGIPAIVHYVHGPAGLQPTAVRLAGDRGDNIEWTYEITVLPGQTLRLAHFTILADMRAAAAAAADTLVTSDGFGGQAAALLSSGELNSLANFFYNDPPTVEHPIADLVVAEDAANWSIDLDGVFTDPDLPSDVLTYSVTVTTPVLDLVNQITVASYTHLHQDLLYTHSGDNRGLTGPEHDLARDNIESYFAGLGLDTSLDPFTYGGQTYYNVVGIKPGTTRANDIYIVGAHYDSTSNDPLAAPGADDNASGTAAVMEIARVLSQQNFEATLVFIAFDREEQGLYGSTAYAGAHASDKILGMISLDMIAYNPVGVDQNKVRLYDYQDRLDDRIKDDLTIAFAAYGGGVVAVNSDQNGQSDHKPFEQQGFDAAMVIEYNVWSNPHYHKATDAVETPNYIDYTFATNVTRAVTGYLADAATTILDVSIDGALLALDFLDDTNGVVDVTVRATDLIGEFAEDTFRVTVNAVNDAPQLDPSGTMTLAAIDYGDTGNSGTLVSEIIASAGGDRITDADSDAMEGIAVVGVDNSNGTWEFSTDGAAWTAFGSPSVSAARLLASDALTRVRFVPSAGYYGTVDPGITFHAWDQTDGVAGATHEITATGGASAFSATSETAAITVVTPPGTLLAALIGDTLTVADINPAGTDNQLTVLQSGTDLVISDPNGQFGVAPAGGTLTDGGHTLTIPIGAVAALVTNLAGGNDVLSVDFSGGNPIPSGGLNYDGGAGSDELTLAGAAFHTSTFTYASLSDGAVSLDPDGTGAAISAIHYVGLEPITSSIASNVVELVYSGGSETITVTDAGGGQTTVSSTLGELTTFANPTELLAIIATGGTDILNINSLAGGYASLAIRGDDATDVVNFNGPLTFALNCSLTVADVGTVNLPNTISDIAATGIGAVSVTALRNIAMAAGSSVTAVDGDVALSANRQAMPTTGGPFAGIWLAGATVTVSGTGDVDLAGRGGTYGDANHGIRMESGSVVSGGATGLVTVEGSSEARSGSDNHGVLISGSDSRITSTGGNIELLGTGGADDTSFGIQLESGGRIQGTTGAPTLTLTADSMNLLSTTSVDAGGNTVVLRPRTAATAATQINLGGADILTGSPLTLGLTDAELDSIVAGTLTIGDTNTSTITVSSPITHGNHLVLTTGAGINFNHAVTLAADKGLTGLAASTISLANAAADLAVAGSGSLSLTTSRNISMGTGSSITTADGDITLSANQQVSATSGSGFTGISLATAAITSTGSGDITLAGRGGTSGTDNRGVAALSGATITGGTAGTVTITGFGGLSDGAYNPGVYVSGTNARITSNGAAIVVTGTGGGTAASGFNHGVHVANSAVITSAGTGAGATVAVTGFGGIAPSSNGTNVGVYVSGLSARITSSGGAVTVNGTGGGAGSSPGNYGVNVGDTAIIDSAGAEAAVTVRGFGGNTAGTGFLNVGVALAGSSRVTSAGGPVRVEGTGGGAGTGDRNWGVLVAAAGVITSAGAGPGATVTVIGAGGNRTGSANGNYGVYVTGTNSRITSDGGNVRVEGTGGGATTSATNYGVYVDAAAGIASTGSSASVSVLGIGGNTAGSDGSNNHGVFVNGSGSQITSAGGPVLVEGTGGGAGASVGNYGVYVFAAAMITSAGSGSGATVTVRGFGGNTTGSGNYNFGVYVAGTGAKITSTGGGVVEVEGTGGGGGTGANNHGVFVSGAGTITNDGTDSGATVTVTGFGGNTTGSGGANYGVLVSNNSQVTSNGGAVHVEGTGGGGGTTGSNVGVYVDAAALITSAITDAATTVTVRGLGGNSGGTAGSANIGVAVRGNGSQITSGGGAVRVEGTGGGAGTGIYNYGVRVSSGAAVTSATEAATVTVIGVGGNSGGAGDDNYGVYVVDAGSSVTSAGGAVFVEGTGGGAGASNRNHGVYVNGGAAISNEGVAPEATVIVRGFGGNVAGTGGSNDGVLVQDAGSQITSSGGAVLVEGTGGGGVGGSNAGVHLISNGTITSAGSASGATVTVKGAGGNSTGGGHFNHGVHLYGANAQITSSGGAVSVEGTGGGAGTSRENSGVYVDTGGMITSAGADVGATVTVKGLGGNAAGNYNVGVMVGGTDASITSGGGAVLVEGTGGGADSSIGNYGVYVFSAGTVTSAGTGAGATVTVTGFGGNTTAMGDSNFGVYVAGIDAQITSGGGAVLVEGAGGGAGASNRNYGVRVGIGGTITGSGSTVTVRGEGGNSGGTGRENHGVYVSNSGSQITSSGGDVIVEGAGGGGGISVNNCGVYVTQEGTITSAAAGAAVTVRGSGGNTTGTGGDNYGVYVNGVNSRITSSSGAVLVEGTGGGAGSSLYNLGVNLYSSGTVTSEGTGPDATVTVKGFGGNTAGNGSHNHGVLLFYANAEITSAGGDVEVIGEGGGGAWSVGIRIDTDGQVNATAGTPTVTLTADSMNLISTTSVDAGANPVILRPFTPGTRIDLGGPDVLTGSPLTLGLSDAELDSILAGTLAVGDVTSGTIALTAEISRAAATDVHLVTGGEIVFNPGSIDTAGGNLLLAPGAGSSVQPITSGTDITAAEVSFASTLEINISGTTVDTEYWQLNVAGDVDLSGVALALTGSPTLSGGETFTIVNNGGGSLVTGTFVGLIEEAVISNFLGSGRDASITYVGGDGNDVVLSVASPAPSTVVGRHFFYNNSKWDGNSPAADASDDYAIVLSSTAEDTGAHAGPDNQSNLTDLTKTWATDVWVGYWVVNLSDGSHGPITANTANTITATLGRGAENDWDGGDAYTIVAPKTALLPSQTATFDNYSSYSRGINGLMVDIAGLADPEAVTLGDFSFSTSIDGSTWTAAAVPVTGSPWLRAGAGADGSDRFTFTWTDGAIKNQWLKVTVQVAGLDQPDLFYFGNLVADSGQSLGVVNLSDYSQLAQNYGKTGVPITHPIDFDRGGSIGLGDYSALAQSYGRSMQPITAPAPLWAAAWEAAPSSQGTPLTAQLLEPVARSAVARWAAAGTDAYFSRWLAEVEFRITDLPAGQLGMASPGDGVIYLDDDAAGYGWFIDATPAADEEFASDALALHLSARIPAAAERIDLLTVLMHELGHLSGLADEGPAVPEVMGSQLRTGIRRMPTADEVLAVHDTVWADDQMDPVFRAGSGIQPALDLDSLARAMTQQLRRHSLGGRSDSAHNRDALAALDTLFGGHDLY